MALIEDQFLQTPLSSGDIERIMIEKATELFNLCDKEEKGFITKRDMQRLQAELPLTPDQLEAVFDSLDDDKNGFLSLDEFTGGFGSFLGIHSSDTIDMTDSEQIYQDDDGNAEEEVMFNEMIGNLGAKNLFDDESTIRALWGKLRKEEPEMQYKFETFLSKISSEKKRTEIDFNALEAALRTKSSAHDKEVRNLYEEMEAQIKQEKARLLAEEKFKERQLKEEMDRDLSEKDKQLQELLTKHQEMENRLAILNVTEAETKQSNDKLMREKDSLEEMLLNSQSGLEDSRSYISQLRLQQREEKRERARTALKVTEGIALERESLVKQLDLLRNVNKKLRDDRDEIEARQEPVSNLQDELSEAFGAQLPNGDDVPSPPRKRELEKQGSILSDYFSPERGRSRDLSEDFGGEDVDSLPGLPEDDGIEYDDNCISDDSMTLHRRLNGSNLSNGHASPLVANHRQARHLLQNETNSSENEMEAVARPRRPKRFPSKKHLRCDDDTEVRAKRSSHHLTAADEEVSDNIDMLITRSLEDDIKDRHTTSDDLSVFDPMSPRVQPVGALTEEEGMSETIEPESPERVFKVVFVGDSGVGKSTFIHMFCHNHFKGTFSATIGVDFQIKSLLVEGHRIALQLWDTAGQERFRSITKQYFRKADGVLVMYDVTAEMSFTNVRNWMNSVQEGVEEGTVLVMVGNKTDLSQADADRVIKHKDGRRLADEYGALFYETSAKSGNNVDESLRAMANLLREKEDLELEKSLRLEDIEKKKGCCSKS